MPDKLPPLSWEDLQEPLQDPSLSVYLYIGKEADKGWKVAKAIYGLMPRLRVYLVKDIALIGELVGSKKPRGVVFGWEPKPYAFLTAAQASDMLIVAQKIAEARAER
jgi:hypothetical protein